MKKIYYIPIEPLEERYTEQWYRWFPETFKNNGHECIVIDGNPLTDVIETGTFLDINSTVYYKSEQLKKISKLFYEKKIESGDIFFVADLEFWGIEVIRYLSTLNNIPVKIYGFNHAMSYTKEDFMSKAEPFAINFEKGWHDICDVVFVGSEYHKKQIIKLRGINPDKIIVTGNPYKIPTNQSYKKTKTIICTNRPDYEKRPNLSLDVFYILKEKHPDWNFVVTTGRSEYGSGWIREKALKMQKDGIITIKEGITKQQYFEEIQKSMIMTGNSIEENFGYCILEAMMFNCIPILPNNYSHPELVKNDKRMLFNTIDEQVNKIEYAMEHHKEFNVYSLAKPYKNVLNEITEIITK